ncbi:ABC transporter permease subunit [Glycomyces algeriensis]|uniref:ABC transporter permease n=1 Tax=Glycomyces algeriensis TaxID=256037 RepID=A0A9W6GDL4_9ACTN|nr:ABC transporter permease subunit [Glycomyces algeriensis]MDA1368546.1 ABC transporter permease subunit [Glycomyces algeriensis]MDR7352345.1 ABC-type dipeptide/oligopeptide/nickel transport system permease subunit [Glycomyces algeriensis]GLI45081.1 ABC transporter permease [Glycomyces algeriensis]
MALLRGTLTRTLVLLAVLAAIGLLPWLADRDPALTVLRARYPGREATDSALDAVRGELGLDAGPLAILRDWLLSLSQGDFGTSWTSGAPVADTVLPALGTSLTVMAAALAVTFAVTAAACAPALRRAAEGRPVGPGGVAIASFAALPDFLLATLGVAVFATWTGLLPAYGFNGPANLVLPALAMGLPGGGVLARLGRDAIGRVAAEDWVRQWRTAGYPKGRIAAGLLRRALPPVLPQFAIIAVSITGAAVAVETIFAVPGLGRAALAAADAQDLPVLQACMALLIGLGFAAGLLARLAARALDGPAADAAAIPATPPATGERRRHRAWIAATAAPLLLAVAYGLMRSGDIATGSRLDAPSAGAWLGTDELGRDVLARLGQGALWTTGAAFLACALAYLLALGLGFAPRLAHPLAEAFNSFPVAIAGMIAVVVLGRGQLGAVLAVVAVSWPPLAAHAAELTAQARAAGHLEARLALGAGPWWILHRHTLPLVAGPLAAHAGLRLPGMALGIASLGFLGLGAEADAPEWGASLARSLPYLERAPLAALAPAAAMIALTLAVMAAVSLPKRRPR